MDMQDADIQDRMYLLSIEEFLTGERREHLLESAFAMVDAHRGQKARRMKPGRAQAACLGAGLLLQLAVRDATGAVGEPEEWKSMHPAVREATGAVGEPEGMPFTRYTVSELPDRLPEPISLTYRYGENGKPYFKDYPFYFNLSHSGDYVFCVLSRQEVGADIQQHRACHAKRLAERFFTERETAAMEACGEAAASFFFRLWARKEAYGKLTGRGIAGTVGIDLLPGAEAPGNDKELIWEECDTVPGYSIAVCRYRI